MQANEPERHPADDPLRSRLSEIDRAATDLIDALDALRRALAAIDRARAEGSPVSTLVGRGPLGDARRDVGLAWMTLSHALKDYRIESIRLMVEQEGMTLAEVARVTHNARQVISRLYHSDGDE